MCTYMCICTQYMRMHAHRHMHTRTHAFTRTHTHTHKHTHAHTHTRTHTHTHTHTHLPYHISHIMVTIRHDRIQSHLVSLATELQFTEGATAQDLKKKVKTVSAEQSIVCVGPAVKNLLTCTQHSHALAYTHTHTHTHTHSVYISSLSYIFFRLSSFLSQFSTKEHFWQLPSY